MLLKLEIVENNWIFTISNIRCDKTLYDFYVYEFNN